MRQILSSLLSLLLIFAPLSIFAQRKTAAVNKPTKARFIVQVTYDDEYKSVTDKPNQVDAQRPHDTGKTESKLHFELQASRWIQIQTGDGGATEFLALEGGEPSAATGAVSFNASEESQSDNGTGDKNRIVSRDKKTASFTGKIQSPDVIREDSAVFLGVPQFSELGNGLEFRLKINTTVAGNCHWTTIDENGTKNFNDCSSASTGFAEGFTPGEENKALDKTPATAYLADFVEDFTFYPALNQEQQKLQSEIEREKMPGVWIGAVTRGDRQAGYKMNLTKTKTILQENQDGVSREETQKIIVNAEITPGGTTALFNSTERLSAELNFQLDLMEVTEKSTGEIFRNNPLLVSRRAINL